MMALASDAKKLMLSGRPLSRKTTVGFERKDGGGKFVLLAHQLQRVTVAQVGVGPGLAAGLLVVAQHHDDMVRMLGALDGLTDVLAVDLGSMKLTASWPQMRSLVMPTPTAYSTSKPACLPSASRPSSTETTCLGMSE